MLPFELEDSNVSRFPIASCFAGGVCAVAYAMSDLVDYVSADEAGAKPLQI